jgi:hypothetical protein
MAMRIRRYDAEHIAHDGRSRATLDAIGRCHWAQIFAPYCPGGCHVHQFWLIKLSCGVVKLLFQS